METLQPWYLQSVYDPTDLQVDLEGIVKAGTLKGLVEYLTTHEQHGEISYL